MEPRRLPRDIWYSKLPEFAKFSWENIFEGSLFILKTFHCLVDRKYFVAVISHCIIIYFVRQILVVHSNHSLFLRKKIWQNYGIIWLVKQQMFPQCTTCSQKFLFWMNTVCFCYYRNQSDTCVYENTQMLMYMGLCTYCIWGNFVIKRLSIVSYKSCPQGFLAYDANSDTKAGRASFNAQSCNIS